MYKLAVKESLDKKFKKLHKKDMEMLRLIERKVVALPFLPANPFAAVFFGVSDGA